MGLQQGNEMGSNYMRMYDAQTSNFVNNMARTLAQRELNMYNIMTAGYPTGGGGGGAGAQGDTGTAAPVLSEFPNVEQYINNTFAANLALTGRTPEGYAIPGARNVMPVWAMPLLPTENMYGTGAGQIQWLGRSTGPTQFDISGLTRTPAEQRPVTNNTRGNLEPRAVNVKTAKPMTE